MQTHTLEVQMPGFPRGFADTIVRGAVKDWRAEHQLEVMGYYGAATDAADTGVGAMKTLGVFSGEILGGHSYEGRVALLEDLAARIALGTPGPEHLSYSIAGPHEVEDKHGQVPTKPTLEH